jgi:hypothetical protein
VLCKTAGIKALEFLDGNYGEKNYFLKNISRDVNFFTWIKKWRTAEHRLSDGAIWLKTIKNFWQKQTLK